MGRFTDADRTFQLVQQRYPNTDVARFAHDQTGIRSFYVQLATFNSAAGADRAIESLQSSELAIGKHPDSNGHTVIDAGPFPSYDAAREIKTRFEQQYPDAIIVP
jgi:cell division septation protein DedD